MGNPRRCAQLLLPSAMNCVKYLIFHLNCLIVSWNFVTNANQRLKNNLVRFQKAATTYLLLMHQQGYFKVNPMYWVDFEYLSYLLPKLGSYQAFNSRLNRLTRAFNKLVKNISNWFSSLRLAAAHIYISKLTLDSY